MFFLGSSHKKTENIPIDNWKDFLWQNENKISETVSCACGTFTYVCWENCMSDFSAFVLNLSKSGNILFRSMANGNCLFCSASIVIG